MKAERSIPNMVMNKVKPDSPASRGWHQQWVGKKVKWLGRTWTDAPFRLKRCYGRVAGHCKEIEKYLGGMKYDGGF
jgi:hypothetical protein